MNEPRKGLERSKQTPVSFRLLPANGEKQNIQAHEWLSPHVSNNNLSRSYSKSHREIIVIGRQSGKNEIWTLERAMLVVLRKIRGFPDEHKRKFIPIFLLDPYVYQRDPSYLYKSMCYAFGHILGKKPFTNLCGMSKINQVWIRAVNGDSATDRNLSGLHPARTGLCIVSLFQSKLQVISVWLGSEFALGLVEK